MDAIVAWARAGRSRYLCAANVRLVTKAYDDEHFRRVVNSADLVTSNDPILAKVVRMFGIQTAVEVRTADLMRGLCRRAAAERLPVAILAGNGVSLASLRSKLRGAFPGVDLVFLGRLPACELSVDQDDALVAVINESGARILLVGGDRCAGAKWMLAHKGRVNAVMLSSGGFLRERHKVGGLLHYHAAERCSEAATKLRFATLVLRQIMGLSTIRDR